MVEIKLTKKEIKHAKYLVNQVNTRLSWCLDCKTYNGPCKYYQSLLKKLSKQYEL